MDSGGSDTLQYVAVFQAEPDPHPGTAMLRSTLCHTMIGPPSVCVWRLNASRAR